MVEELIELVEGALNIVWTPRDDRPRRVRAIAIALIVLGTLVIGCFLIFLALVVHAY